MYRYQLHPDSPTSDIAPYVCTKKKGPCAKCRSRGRFFCIIFFIKEFEREKGKKKEILKVGFVCGWFGYRYTWRNGLMMMVVVMMMMIGSLLLFFFVLFVLLVHVHVPFGHTETTDTCIDDDMNNKHVHFFVFPSFFPVLSVPTCTLGTWVPPTRYVYLLDGDTYAFDDLQLIAAEDRSSKRFRTPISFFIIMIGHSLLLDRMTCRLLFRTTCSCTVSTTYPTCIYLSAKKEKGLDSRGTNDLTN